MSGVLPFPSSSRVILSAAKEPDVQENAGIELCSRLSSNSAPRAPSGGEVSCTEKDPGFFAALRMTQKKERAGARASARMWRIRSERC